MRYVLFSPDETMRWASTSVWIWDFGWGTPTVPPGDDPDAAAHVVDMTAEEAASSCVIHAGNRWILHDDMEAMLRMTRAELRAYVIEHFYGGKDPGIECLDDWGEE